MSKFFVDQSQEFVGTRTYFRWVDDLGRRENWEEVTNRVIDFFESERGKLIPKKVLRKIKQYMLSVDVVPSMRVVWAAGEPAKRDNTCMYNCAFVAVDSIKAFSECLYILMCGTGVGFSVESRYIDKLPIVNELTSQGSGIYVISDDKKGWAESTRLLIGSLYEGKDLQFDYSNIRKKGERLLTMGGRASGPEPLISLHNFLRELFSKAQGRKLTDIECHDIMCQIAEIVVVGGVRRSSEISLSDLSSKSMRDAKTGSFPLRRYMANNSAVYEQKPTAVEFLGEWGSLAASGSGERGIFNLGVIQKKDNGRRNWSLIQGTNPSLRAGTRVWTKEFGMVPIEELQDKNFTVKGLNGNLCDAKCWLSSNNAPLYKIELANGFTYYATAEHKWAVLDKDGNYTKITTDKLKTNMELPRLKEQDLISYKDEGTYEEGKIIGYFYGDGWITDRKDSGKRQYGVIVPNNIDRKKPYKELFKKLFNGNGYERPHGVEFNSCSKQIHSFFTKYGVDKKEKGLPEFIFRKASNQFINGFIQGYFDADGHISKDSRHSISSKDYKLIKDFQTLLGFKGRYYSLTNQTSDGYTGANGKEYIKKVIRHQLRRNISKIGTENSVKIKNIQLTNIKEPVWDISVNDSDHCFQLAGVITGNCGEITLRSMQFCNLSEVIIKANDDLDDLMEKVECATWIGVIQSTFTTFPYLRKKWKTNCDEERLLGVSLSGQMDNPKIMTKDNLTALRKKAIKVAKKASKIMGVNVPTAITTGKPSGTVSQLANCASGCHPRYAKYYIRRYRISADDPLCYMLKDQKIPMSPEVGQRKSDVKNWKEENVNTWVVEFPIKSPENSVTRDMVSALDQLEHYKLVQENWCEHNQSVTIYVKDEEWFEVGNWVYENWEYVNGVSFLPYDGGIYELAPYEEIDKDTYQKLFDKFPKIDYTKLSLYEKDDNTEGSKSYACVGNKCEIS